MTGRKKEYGAALVWCPFPDAETARAIAGDLLERELIACANIIPAIELVFMWNGELDRSTEVAVLFKTTQNCLDALVSRLGEAHPYDTPAIVGWRCDASLPATLSWLNAVTREE